MQIHLSGINKFSNIINPYLTKKTVSNNLSPLKADTVTFSGSAALISTDMKHAPSEKVCIQAAENAEPARYYLQLVFDTYIKPIAKQGGNSDKNSKSAFTTSTRIKTPASIREKVVSKYSKMTSLNFDELFNIIIDELLKNFEVSDDVDIDYIKSVCKQDLDTSVNDLKNIPRYSISVYAVRMAADVMKKNNLIKTSDKTEAEQEEIFSEITKKIDSEIVDAEYDETAMQYPTTSVEGVKKYANDIVGGRIVISRNEDVSKIIQALKKAVTDGKLRITSIEHYIPDKDKIPAGRSVQDYAYASDTQLKCLGRLADCEVVDIPSKSGYMGVHVNVDLSNPLYSGYNSKFNGYTGEIQILGKDVEQLKDVEDLCYKLKDKKNAINKVYTDFRKHFYRYYTDESKNAFNEYTYALYLAQRLNSSRGRSKEFPSIADLGYSGRVDENLDFNLLRKIKSVGDYKRDRQDEEQKKQMQTDNDVIRSLKSSIAGTF